MMTWFRRTITAAVLISLSCVAFADPPSESGRVIRIDNTDAFTWVDFKTGYRVVVGVDVYEFCNGIVNFSTFPIQVVDIPTLENAPPDNRAVINGGAYLPVQVFDFLVFDCGMFLARGPVAAGIAKFHVVDSDFFGTVETNDANAWGFTAHGRITELSTGKLVMLAAKLRLMFNSNSDGIRFSSTVNLN